MNGAKHSRQERDCTSAMDLEVKRAAEGREGWRAINRSRML